MNWEFIVEYLPLYEKATVLTVRIGLLGIAFAMVQYHRIPVVRQIVAVYIELSRNTPLLVQLFFIYYGLQKVGLQLSLEICGVAGLAFLGGSYMAEAFRGGLEAVSKGQIESALSIGLTPYQAFRYVIFPQAFAIATPAIGANCLFLMKETSVISAVAVAELMFVAKEVIGLDYKTNEALFLLVVFYLIILLPMSLFISYLERRTRRAKYGA